VSGEIVDSLEELNARCHKLEQLVCVLARGILQHEYSKDLCRNGTEAVCKVLANDEDIDKALQVLAEYNEG
jgi:hypothetical protein